MSPKQSRPFRALILMFAGSYDARLMGRRASTSGSWSEDDFDVLDSGRRVGRVYRINAPAETWWLGVDFRLTDRRRTHRDEGEVALVASLKEKPPSANPAASCAATVCRGAGERPPRSYGM